MKSSQMVKATLSISLLLLTPAALGVTATVGAFLSTPPQKEREARLTVEVNRLTFASNGSKVHIPFIINEG
ncbi:MAG: hypothetical protein JSU63_07855, partial [Phycisphaerales bacterium]